MEEQNAQVAAHDRMNAFVLRIAPSIEDRVDEALKDGDLIIGWSLAKGLLDTELDWLEFRESVHKAYYAGEASYRKAGSAAGSMWRFIRDMKPGDLVVTPHGSSFYVGRVIGPPRFEPDKVDTDTAYRRKVEWLNNGKPFARSIARAALIARMKIWHTCGAASDLVEQVQEVLDLGSGANPSFSKDLRKELVSRTLHEIRNGRMEDRGFEKLIANVLTSMGGTDVRIVSRNLDKGADILANFNIANTFEQLLAVQAKHFQPEPPVPANIVDDLVQGMEAEGATLGWVATSGTFTEAADKRRIQLEQEKGVQIVLVDGELLAAMVVEGGLRQVMPAMEM